VVFNEIFISAVVVQSTQAGHHAVVPSLFQALKIVIYTQCVKNNIGGNHRCAMCECVVDVGIVPTCGF
jgi:hypothetical protein